MNSAGSEDFSATERFSIIRRLGAGGMGVVYEAYDRERDVRVALKTLRRFDARELYRFKREFRALADVIHPNLVALHELIGVGEQWFFTMEIVHGVHFLDFVCDRPKASSVETRTAFGTAPSADEIGGRVTPRTTPTQQEGMPDRVLSTQGSQPKTTVQTAANVSEIADIIPAQPGVIVRSKKTVAESQSTSPARFDRLRAALGQLTDGLCAIHRAGKLHRDIKPTNVLVTPEGRVVILDFGLAGEWVPQPLEGETEDEVAGTLSYMSPEQAAGLPLSPASDWYSVGAMLYQALTGRLPSRRTTDRPVPSALMKGIPEDLDTLCVELLRHRPEDRPTGLQIRGRLNRASGHATPLGEADAPWVQRTVFVGRERHLAQLEDAFTTVKEGHAVTVHVHGRSGLGKSALVQHFLECILERHEAIILSGRCYEREAMPYKALDSLVDALSRHLCRLSRQEVEALLPADIQALVRVFPVLRRVEAVANAPRSSWETPDQQELRRRAFTGLRQLLGRIGQRTPLVLAVDDLQWGDVDSALLLGELLRPPDPPVLLLLASYRSEDVAVSPFLRTLFHLRWKLEGTDDRREVLVDALSLPEALTLARSLLDCEDSAAEAHADAIARESGGNPLFVYGLVQFLQAGAGQMEQSPSTAKVTLDTLLRDRLQRLPEAAKRLLEVAAVSGRPLPQGDVCRAAGVEREDRGSLNLLRAARLVRSTGPGEQDKLETFHDRIRESVVAQLGPQALKDCHGRLARALETTGHADPESLAVHFDGAEEVARAAYYYGIAAEQAAQALAFDRAAKLYRLALELGAQQGSPQRELRIKLGEALANAGRGVEAAREYESAAIGAEEAQALDLERRVAYHYCSSGHLQEGRAALEAVLRRVGMNLPRTPRRTFLSLVAGQSRLWLRGVRYRQRDAAQIDPEDLNRIDVAWSASAGLSMFDVVGGADFQTRNLLLALEAGEPYRLARALAWQAAHTANLGGGRWARTTQLLQEARTLSERIDHPQSRGFTTLCEGISEWTTGRWKQARASLERAEKILRDFCTGVAWELGTAHTFTLWSLFYLGEFAEMERRSSSLLREAQDRGDLYAATTLGTFSAAMARLGTDDPEGARQIVEAFLKQWSHNAFHVQHVIALLSLTYIDLYCRNGVTAWTRVSEQWPALARSHLLRVQVIRVMLTNARARSALAAADGARDRRSLWRWAKRDAQRMERERMPYAQAFAGLIHAGLAAQRGDRAGALRLFAGAAGAFDGADMPLFAAAARRRQGELLGGAEGLALVEGANARMKSKGIGDPLRMNAALAPGVDLASGSA
jgi:eukaryotic-like serine/threonine-protein kinase